MKIKNVILYNRKSEIHSIPFSTTKINMIIGNSDTGKTALLNIIDYCLGGNTPPDFAEAENNIISWYAVYLELSDKTFLFIARKKMLNKNDEVIFVERNDYETEPPQIEDLYQNRTLKELKEQLAQILGISKFNLDIETNIENEIEDKKETLTLEICYDVSARLCFLPEKIINDTSLYFYTSDKRITNENIKTLLPYFLGTKSESYFEERKKYNDFSKKRNEALKIWDKHRYVFDKKKQEAIKTLREAESIGMLAKDFVYDIYSPPNKFVELLKMVAAAADSFLKIEHNQEVLDKHQEKLNENTTILQKIRAEKKGLTNLKSELNNYKKQHQTHIERLRTVDLYIETHHSVNTCPLCNNDLQKPVVSIQNIKKSFEDLGGNLVNEIRDFTNIDKEVEKLDKEIEKYNQKQKEIKAEIEIELKNSDYLKNLEKIKSEQLNIAFIAQYLINDDIWDSGIQQYESTWKNYLAITNTIQRTLKNLNTEAKQNEENVIDKIGQEMSKNAEKITSNTKNKTLKFSLKNLNVIANSIDNNSENLGGGDLTLKVCHILLFLSLHKRFIKENKPVPRFLIVSNLFKDEILNVNEEKANKNIEIIELLTKNFDDMQKQLQMIIIDDPKDTIKDLLDSNKIIKDIDKTKIEIIDWSNGQALIPKEWKKG